MAARAVNYGSALCGWAIKRGTLTTNPFADIPVTPATKRERVLRNDELAAVWRATEGPGVFNAISAHVAPDRAAARRSRRHDVGRDFPRRRNVDPPGVASEKQPRPYRAPVHAGAGDYRRPATLQRLALVFPGRGGPAPSTATPSPRPPSTKRAASRIGRCTICVGRAPPGCRSSACGSK